MGFKEAKLAGSDFSGAILLDSSFEGADLRSVIFKDTYFSNTSFEGAEVNENFLEELEHRKKSGDPIHEMYDLIRVPVKGYGTSFRVIKKANYNDLLKYKK